VQKWRNLWKCSKNNFLLQQIIIGILLAAAIISADAKLFKKKKLKKLGLLGGWFGLPKGGLFPKVDHGLTKEEITVEKPKIVEIVKHVPVIQKVEVIKPVEVIRTVQVPGKKI
jgi:hypothetical protein